MDDTEKRNILILSGGGIKSILQLGALHQKYESGKLSDIMLYVGTSAGAAISLLLCIGYSPLEIFDEVQSDNSLFDNISVKRLFTTFGLLSLDKFINKIEKLIKKKLSIIPTFEELYLLTSKDLMVDGTNISKLEDHKEFFNRKSSPNKNVLDCIRISCSVPIIFDRVYMDGCYYVDGGMLGSLPISESILLFSQLYPQISTPPKIFAIELWTMDPVTKEDSVITYIYKLSTIVFSKIRNYNNSTSSDDVHRLVLSYPKNSILDFNMSKEKKLDMFTFGYKKSEKSSS